MFVKVSNILYLVTGVLFGLVMLSNRLLPETIRYASIFFVVLLYFPLKKHQWIKLMISIVLIIAMLPLVYAQSMMDTALNQEDYEVQNFSVYVLNESEFKTMPDLSGYAVTYPRQIETEFQDVISYEWIDLELDYVLAEHPAQAAEMLLNHQVQAVLLDNVSIETFEAFELDFLSNVRVIADYQKEIVRSELNKPKDIRRSPFIVYFSGLDVVGPINTVSRSDVNILAAVHPSLGIIDMYSLARDSYFPIACMKDNYDKLTHAGWRGLDCSIKTLENAFDLEVNYYVKVNFSSFMNIIDAFGTIDVYSPFAFASGGYRFRKGMNAMDAKKALAFARERKAFALGDLQRGLNQQEVIKALLQRIMAIRDLTTLNRLVDQIGKYVDTNIDSEDIGKLLALQIANNPSWVMTSHMLEGERGSAPSYAFGGQYQNMVFPDPDSVDEITRQISDLMKKR